MGGMFLIAHYQIKGLSMNKNIDIFWSELINNEDYKLQIIDIGAAEMEDVTPSYQKFIDLNIANIIGFEPNENECKMLNQNSKIKDSNFSKNFIELLSSH